MMIQIISPETVVDNLPQYRILDVSQPATHARMHIPGALPVDAQALIQGTPPAPGEVPTHEQLTALCQSLALKPDDTILVYDDEGGGWAGRLLWTLEYLGFQDLHYLDGGLIAWAAAQYPLTDAPTPHPAPIMYDYGIDKKRYYSAPDIIAALDNPKCKLIDTRPTTHFRTHIPGAINIPSSYFIQPQDNYCYQPATALETLLKQHDIAPDDTVICYCMMFHSATRAYVALSNLGYTEVAGYPGSWLDWQNYPNAPVATDE